MNFATKGCERSRNRYFEFKRAYSYFQANDFETGFGCLSEKNGSENSRKKA